VLLLLLFEEGYEDMGGCSVALVLREELEECCFFIFDPVAKEASEHDCECDCGDDIS
jgi:hypothetical protein